MTREDTYRRRGLRRLEALLDSGDAWRKGRDHYAWVADSEVIVALDDALLLDQAGALGRRYRGISGWIAKNLRRAARWIETSF